MSHDTREGGVNEYCLDMNAHILSIYIHMHIYI